MGTQQLRKGKRREREVARLLNGQRVPLSGSVGGQFGGDVVLFNGWRAEVKSRRDGFRQIYSWLEGRDLLLLKADRRPWLVVLPLEHFKKLLERASADDAGS